MDGETIMKKRVIETHWCEHPAVRQSERMNQSAERDWVPFIERKLQVKRWWGWKTVERKKIKIYLHEYIQSCTMGTMYNYDAHFPATLQNVDKVIYSQ